ncbi:nucleotidyltransferase family protein [Citrus sinensis]|uniref:Nucleotidyltransferase family protein n=2 Tax=Citrus sinensis TaxID=2711 RepID=A0ACB8NXT0_CITSI|nr:nucleotidyltransferase family protein [Citrus sinensis]
MSSVDHPSISGEYSRNLSINDYYHPTVRWFKGNSRFKSPTLQMHKEIVDFCDFLSPTSEEREVRTTAGEAVLDLFKYTWPKCKPKVFGTFRTGLYLPTSDIDVVIMESGIHNPATGLQALSRALLQRGIAKKIQVIAKARVPIVKFFEKKSGVSFDISFDAQNGPKAAEFIKDALAECPPLRPLCLILKVFLQQRELNEVYSGGIGSFALLTMIMAVLKIVNDVPYMAYLQSLYKCRASPEHNLGILLVNFFDFYGRKLKTTDVGVSCKGAGSFFKKSSKGFTNKGRPFLIAIEDPQIMPLGRTPLIISSFCNGIYNLDKSKDHLEPRPNRSILGTIIRPDPVLLERKGGSNGEITFNSLLPGAGEPLKTHFGDQREIMCNWQSDYEEESFARGNGSVQSCGKRRKAFSKEKSTSKKKTEEIGESKSHEEGGSKKEKSGKKKCWRQNRGHANGFS